MKRKDGHTPMLTILTLPDVNSDVVEKAYESFSDKLDNLSGLSFSQILDMAADTLLQELPRLGKAFLVFLLGYLLILGVMKMTRRILGASKTDRSLHNFILSTVKAILMVLLVLVVLELLGVKLTPLITMLGVLGLALSLSVQDTLANLAGGITLLFTRPFARGNYVEINGQPGTIIELGFVYTQMLTLDNKKIYLPNGDVAKASIINYSAEPVRRLDLTFPIKARSDYAAARRMMLEVIGEAPLALQDPPPVVRMTDQTFAYVKMTAMVWVNTPDLLELSGYLIWEIRRRIVEEDL